MNFIKDEYLKKNKKSKREINTYVTTAIDEKSMKNVLIDIQKKIILTLEKN